MYRQYPALCFVSIAAKCLGTLSGLFPPNLINQSSCRILTTHAKTRPILHDDWRIRLGENRLERAMLALSVSLKLVYICFLPLSLIFGISCLYCCDRVEGYLIMLRIIYLLVTYAFVIVINLVSALATQCNVGVLLVIARA